MLTVLPDDDDIDVPDDADPAGLHDLPSGLRTPPTPPADHSLAIISIMSLKLNINIFIQLKAYYSIISWHLMAQR